MRRFLGLSWMGWLNVFIIQWFFIRLARYYTDDTEEQGYMIVKWIVPMTGWSFSPWKRYKFIGSTLCWKNTKKSDKYIHDAKSNT